MDTCGPPPASPPPPPTMEMENPIPIPNPDLPPKSPSQPPSDSIGAPLEPPMEVPCPTSPPLPLIEKENPDPNPNPNPNSSPPKCPSQPPSDSHLNPHKPSTDTPAPTPSQPSTTEGENPNPNSNSEASQSQSRPLSMYRSKYADIWAFDQLPDGRSHISGQRDRVYGRVERVLPHIGLVEITPLVPYLNPNAPKTSCGHFVASKSKDLRLCDSVSFYPEAEIETSVPPSIDEDMSWDSDKEDMYKVLPTVGQVWVTEKYGYVEVLYSELDINEVRGAVLVEVTGEKEEEGTRVFRRRLYGGCEILAMFQDDTLRMLLDWVKDARVEDGGEEMFKNDLAEKSFKWNKRAIIKPKWVSAIRRHRAKRVCSASRKCHSPGRAGAEPGAKTHETAASAPLTVGPSDPENCKNKYDEILEKCEKRMFKYYLERVENLMVQQKEETHRRLKRQRGVLENQYLQIMMDMVVSISPRRRRKKFLGQIKQVYFEETSGLEDTEMDSSEDGDGDSGDGGNGDEASSEQRA